MTLSPAMGRFAALFNIFLGPRGLEKSMKSKVCYWASMTGFAFDHQRQKNQGRA